MPAPPGRQDSGLLDLSAGSDFDRRAGYFSDIHYDPHAKAWWGLSDRGPGGGWLPYNTRAQRFTLDVDPTSGTISNFKIVETVIFKSGGRFLNGQAPSPSNTLGFAFDPKVLSSTRRPAPCWCRMSTARRCVSSAAAAS